MGPESIAIDSEDMRARGIILFWSTLFATSGL